MKKIQIWFKTFAQRMLLASVIACFKLVFLIFFPLEVRGREHLKAHRRKAGNAIFAGNHSGLLDTPILISILGPKLFFFMHDSVHDWPVIGKLVRFARVIVLKPGQEIASLRESLKQLRNGHSLCIFPEGKLSEDGSLNPFQPGTAILHDKSAAPVIPFYIHGGYEAWSWKNRLSPKPRRIVIEFGPPVQLSGAREEMTQTLEAAVRTLQSKHELSTTVLAKAS